MNRNVLPFLISLACFPAVPLPSWGAEKPPEPPELLEQALSQPSVSYQGQMVVTHWNGQNTTAEDVIVRFRPPNQYRWEFLAPDGRIKRIVQSDGKNEWVWIPQDNRLLQGEPVKSAAKLISPQAELKLLLANYTLSEPTPNQVAGRHSWLIKLTPRQTGKPCQHLSVDKELGVILETKRFRPDDDFAVVSRFVRFQKEPSAQVKWKDVKAECRGAASKNHGLNPAFLSAGDFEQAMGKPFDLPQRLPEGFVFESASFFQIGKNKVSHVRYTDGLTVLSVFSTDAPTSLSGAAMPESVYRCKSKRGAQMTLISDTTDDLLRTIATSLK